MISSIILIVSLLLDGILTNYLSYMVSDLSIFTPLLTVTSLVIICPLFYKDTKKYYIYSFIIGFIYDLFYTNLLFFNGLIFLLLAIIISKVYKVFGTGYIKVLIGIIITIVLYESLTVCGIILFNLVPVTLDKLVYKITHSLLLNIVYGELLLVVLKLIPKKYSKVSLN